jgi:phosphopentomutase
MAKMRPDDMLVITADHGCDPGYKGTDHTREDIPCLIWGPSLKKGVDIGTRDTFADMAATIADYLGIDYRGDGTSFLADITE